MVLNDFRLRLSSLSSVEVGSQIIQETMINKIIRILNSFHGDCLLRISNFAFMFAEMLAGMRREALHFFKFLH